MLGFEERLRAAGRGPGSVLPTKVETEGEAEAVTEGETKVGITHPSLTAPPFRGATEPQRLLAGSDLTNWDRHPAFVRDVASLLGISDHERQVSYFQAGDHQLAVALWRDFDGYWKVRIRGGWPTKPRRKVLTLAELYAASITGKARTLKKPEHARFKMRLLIALGREQPAEVHLPALPATAPRETKAVWEALPEYLGVRWRLEEHGSPFPLSAPWFADWSGLTEWTVGQGKLWLRENGFLVWAGQAPGRGRPTDLWVIGTGRTA